MTNQILRYTLILSSQFIKLVYIAFINWEKYWKELRGSKKVTRRKIVKQKASRKEVLQTRKKYSISYDKWDKLTFYNKK